MGHNASNRPTLLRRFACLSFGLALVLAGFGDALRHAHEGSFVGLIVEPASADCVVDHELHESSAHLTPIDEPHVEREGAVHDHGCVGCHGSRIRVAVAIGMVWASMPERAERTLLGRVRADGAEKDHLPAPRGPPFLAIS